VSLDQFQIPANRLPLRVGVQLEEAVTVKNVDPRREPMSGFGAYSCIVGVAEPKMSEPPVKLGFVQCLVATNLC
jgi:hypothetical protein